MKRITDLTLALVGFTLTLPLTLLTAMLIKITSPGPIFYLQERMGERGITFQIIKFRSMRPDAEKDGPQWAVENDDRIDKIGRLIRTLRLDELPQLVNVMKGEMSIVGPRPERPYFVELLEKNIPYYSLRHSIKPGITGWAQISYPYGATEEDALRKLEYDLYYLKNLNLWMDIWIIMQTIKIVLSGKGAR
jgi:exopolysaccharide biosynthesis polyprenyl glycosylphosphotransferase